MIDVRRELVDAIKKQMVADIHGGTSDDEIQDRLFDAAMTVLTPEEVAMPSDKLGRYLAAASAIAIRELDSEILH
jgi:hypothetical protein